MKKLNALIAYAAKLRLRHLKKALGAGIGAAGLVLGNDLIGQHPIHAGPLLGLAAGTAVLTFFAPANETVDQD